jgi:hypothetical protein
MKAAMKFMARHGNFFTDQILENAIDLIQQALQLCVVENIEVRDTANELLGSIIKQISESLQPDRDSHL